MSRMIVGVLRGGTSSEYNLSLKTGATIIKALSEDRYDVRDIFIDRTGIWHVRGMAVSSARALEQVDVVINALHGGMGEDGTVQRFLDTTGIPYTGSGAIGASTSLNKIRTHEIMETAGVRMPHFVSFSLDDRLNTAQMAHTVFSHFGPPYIVKPPREGSSHGIHIADGLIGLPDAIANVLDSHGTALVEEYIRGEHLSTAAIQDFRNENLYVLPPTRQKLRSDLGVLGKADVRFIQSDHHINGALEHPLASHLTDAEKATVGEMMRTAHQALGMEHFSHADFIRTPRHIYLLEVDALPGLYDGASLPPMLESVGSSVSEFLEHAIHLARRGS